MDYKIREFRNDYDLLPNEEDEKGIYVGSGPIVGCVTFSREYLENHCPQHTKLATRAIPVFWSHNLENGTITATAMRSYSVTGSTSSEDEWGTRSQTYDYKDVIQKFTMPIHQLACDEILKPMAMEEYRESRIFLAANRKTVYEWCQSPFRDESYLYWKKSKENGTLHTPKEPYHLRDVQIRMAQVQGLHI